jgi:arylsulfatase A-like enzyme
MMANNPPIQLHKFTTLTLALSFAIWSPIGVNYAKSAEKRSVPNIVIILADDLGYGDLGCCGARDMRTPHLDGLVASGMRFTNFYANSCVCSPTRAALLTGRYPDLVGVPGVIRTHPEDSWGYLSPSAVLLPKLLKDAGYRTGIVGKWHLGLETPNLPNERGFEHFHGFLGDMMDDYLTHRRHGKNYLRLNDREIDPKGHATDLFTAWACDFIKHKADRPFFLYLAYNAPHAPIQPLPEWLEKVQKRQPGIDAKRAKLVALIEHLDDGVGKVLAALKEAGADQNTLIIFTSDNGGQLDLGANNGPLRGSKGSMYEGGLKEPMAAAWPGRIKAGSQSERIFLTMDIFPTVLEAAGVAARQEIDGVSFLPTLLGKDESVAERTLFFVRREGGLAYGGKAIDAVRKGDWKLLQNSPFGPRELYNLRTDPQEKTNVFAQEPKKVQELSAAMRAHLQRAGEVPWQPAKR